MAEDNPMNQRFQRAILERMGHVVIVAENGRDAVTLLNKECFDLVLMDVQMPDMNGIEATRLIRTRNIHIPIVGLTANTQDSLKQSCLDAGMNHFLSKPLVINELNTILQKTTILRLSQTHS